MSMARKHVSKANTKKIRKEVLQAAREVIQENMALLRELAKY